MLTELEQWILVIILCFLEYLLIEFAYWYSGKNPFEEGEKK